MSSHRKMKWMKWDSGNNTLDQDVALEVVEVRLKPTEGRTSAEQGESTGFPALTNVCLTQSKLDRLCFLEGDLWQRQSS